MQKILLSNLIYKIIFNFFDKYMYYEKLLFRLNLNIIIIIILININK
jgi:hypothetical protein